MQNHTYRLYSESQKETEKSTGFNSRLYKSFVLKLLFVFTVAAVLYMVFSTIIQHKEKKQLANEKQNLLIQFELLNDRMGKAENELIRIQKHKSEPLRCNKLNKNGMKQNPSTPLSLMM